MAFRVSLTTSGWLAVVTVMPRDKQGIDFGLAQRVANPGDMRAIIEKICAVVGDFHRSMFCCRLRFLAGRPVSGPGIFAFAPIRTAQAVRKQSYQSFIRSQPQFGGNFPLAPATGRCLWWAAMVANAVKACRTAATLPSGGGPRRGCPQKFRIDRHSPAHGNKGVSAIEPAEQCSKIRTGRNKRLPAVRQIHQGIGQDKGDRLSQRVHPRPPWRWNSASKGRT